MAAFPCPYCGQALPLDAEPKLERCPSCDGTLLIAYRYHLVESHGKVSGGELYLGRDDGFDEKVGVLFVEAGSDAAAIDRFVVGNELFADLGGRGLVKIHEVGSRSDRRPYVVIDWFEGGTLDRAVARRGALEQGALLELVSDLLTGLGKAHRSMPTIVHGHIHPGKIGLRGAPGSNPNAVLFGFEWATQVNAQASHLADSFVTTTEAEEPRRPASDLRQLGVCFYYAATTEWLGDKDLARQRERVRAQVPGPLGLLIDRMLGAGIDGYRSAVDAAIDFEQLMRGVDRWQAPTVLAADRSAERMGTAWAPDDDDDDDDDDDEIEEVEPVAVASSVSPPARPSTPAAAKQPDFAAWAAQRQAEARAQAQLQVATANKSNPARAVILFIGVSIAFTTCIAGILADQNDSPPPPPRFEPVSSQPARVDPIEPEPIEPEPIEPVAPEPEPEIAPPVRTELAGVFHYEGKVVGPATRAGLKLNAKCDIWIEPHDTGLNCRWYIDCGKPLRRIYGGGDVGYSTCTVDEEGRPLTAEDDEDDAPDGAFSADLGSSEPMIAVLDRWIQPPVNVIISVTKGGATDAAIPEVELAPRIEREEIDRRIELDDYPTIESGKLGDW